MLLMWLLDYYMYVYIPMNMSIGMPCMHSLLAYMCACVHVHSVISSTVQGGCTPLYLASEEGHTEVVDTLLKSGADPNLATTVWGLVCSFHPLHVYCVLVHCPTSDRADST